MSRHAKPYVRCEKRGDRLLITVMAGGPSGNILRGRAEVAADDPVKLNQVVQELVIAARAGYGVLEIQADGNS